MTLLKVSTNMSTQLVNVACRICDGGTSHIRLVGDLAIYSD